MSDLILTVDPSSSITKGLYSCVPFHLQLMLMEPELAQLTKSTISNYEKNQIVSAKTIDSAWVELEGKYYAVGFLAQKFYATWGLLELKYKRALYKVLAMVGAIAMENKLPSRFKLSLGLLLPYGEYSDRYRFHSAVKKALSNYRFKGNQYNVELVNFECLPEGAGLLLRGRQKGLSLVERSILVIMIGFRNSSFLVIERGEITRGWTNPLGFMVLLEKAKSMTSGINDRSLISAICDAGKNVRMSSFSHLVSSESKQLRKQELDSLVRAVKIAREQYWQMWLNSITSEIPNLHSLDEIILGGGTAHYFHSELERLFDKTKSNWCEHLEERIAQFLGTSWHEGSLEYRLTDVYGFFFYLLSINPVNSPQLLAPNK